MARRVAPRAESDLDEIWYYVAKESGSIEIANRLIDNITGRFFLLASFPYWAVRVMKIWRRFPQLCGRRLCNRVQRRRRGRSYPARRPWPT